MFTPWGDTHISCVKDGIPTIDCIFPLVQIIINAALTLVGTVAILLILTASIKYITSGGGKGAEEAKNMLTYAIIGLLIVLGSFFIIALIKQFTGVGGIGCLLKFGFGSCQ